MNCPNCHNEVRGWVKETRQKDSTIFRRRLCEVCGEFFSTSEQVTAAPFPWDTRGGQNVTPLAGEVKSRTRRQEPIARANGTSQGADLQQYWL